MVRKGPIIRDVAPGANACERDHVCVHRGHMPGQESFFSTHQMEGSIMASERQKEAHRACGRNAEMQRANRLVGPSSVIANWPYNGQLAFEANWRGGLGDPMSRSGPLHGTMNELHSLSVMNGIAWARDVGRGFPHPACYHVAGEAGRRLSADGCRRQELPRRRNGKGVLSR